MDVLIPALAVVSIFAICAVAVVKMARLRASRSADPEITDRLAEVESAVHRLQQELTETQERVDFAERLLSKGREERRIEG